MDNFNWFVLELLLEQRMCELRQAAQRLTPALHASREERGGIKRALAASLVRLGLRLDPAAGERLGAFDLAVAQPEARRRA